MLSIILAIIGLSVLIFFHEFGHFLTAKLFGVSVEEFSFGYPPRICGLVWIKKKIGWLKYFWLWICYILKKIPQRPQREISRFNFFWGKNVPPEAQGKTIYSINWVPFGGLNKLKGEFGEAEKDSFTGQIWWKKALISVGGPALNIILAILIFSLCLSLGSPRALDEPLHGGKILRIIGIQVGWVSGQSPAEKAGLKAGDVILEVDGQIFTQIADIQNYIGQKAGQNVKIKINRRNQIFEKEINVLPANQVFSDSEETRGVVGIAFANTGIVAYPWYKAILEGTKYTFALIGNFFYGFYLIFKFLFFKQKMLGEFVGPVGIGMMIADVAQIGFIYWLQFIGFLSVAIGVFQIIPFPALDGSRIVLSIVEGIRKRPISQKTEGLWLTIGFYILILLLIIMTFKDLLRLGERLLK